MASAASRAIDDGEDRVALARWNVELGEHAVQERLFFGAQIVVGNHQPSDETANGRS